MNQNFARNVFAVIGIFVLLLMVLAVAPALWNDYLAPLVLRITGISVA